MTVHNVNLGNVTKKMAARKGKYRPMTWGQYSLCVRGVA